MAQQRALTVTNLGYPDRAVLLDIWKCEDFICKNDSCRKFNLRFVHQTAFHKLVYAANLFLFGLRNEVVNFLTPLFLFGMWNGMS
jgi:hypothetical protein